MWGGHKYTERLLRSLLLQVFYSVRSERMLVTTQLFRTCCSGGLWGWRWTGGMESRSVQQESRVLNEEIAESFQRVLERAKPYMSDEHFTVDGTLLEASASQKISGARTGRVSRPDREERWRTVPHGEKRKNQTHESTTDPDARLFKKSKGSEAKLHLGHALIETTGF